MPIIEKCYQFVPQSLRCTGYTTKLTSIYSELDKYPDESLPVKYLSPPGYPRAPAENPLNGWSVYL